MNLGQRKNILKMPKVFLVLSGPVGHMLPEGLLPGQIGMGKSLSYQFEVHRPGPHIGTFFFKWYWGSNSQTCACHAGAAEPNPQLTCRSLFPGG